MASDCINAVRSLVRFYTGDLWPHHKEDQGGSDIFPGDNFHRGKLIKTHICGSLIRRTAFVILIRYLVNQSFYLKKTNASRKSVHVPTRQEKLLTQVGFAAKYL
jgi:hypothetical protein